MKMVLQWQVHEDAFMCSHNHLVPQAVNRRQLLLCVIIS